MNDRSEAMRMRLAQVGIILDEPEKPKPRVDTRTMETVDRAEIRRILIERGARESDLDWMTESCPSVVHARAFVPTKRITLSKGVE